MGQGGKRELQGPVMTPQQEERGGGEEGRKEEEKSFLLSLSLSFANEAAKTDCAKEGKLAVGFSSPHGLKKRGRPDQCWRERYFEVNLWL